MKNLFYIFFIVISINLFSNDIKRVLLIDSQSSDPYKTVREVMIRELERLGYIDGENIEFDYEVAGNFEGRVYNILKSSIDEYDLIFLNGTMAAKGGFYYSERNKDKKYKFLFGNITDPVGLGLVEKLGEKTKGSFTGIAYPVSVEDRLRFIKKIFGNNIKVAYIYADMPQSMAYNVWLKEALAKDEFSDIEVIFWKIEFIRSDTGQRRMTILAEEAVEELESKVDIFLSANDQLGVSGEFAKMVYRKSSKPLVGLADEKGAVLSYGSDLEKNGKKLAFMMKELLDGKMPQDIIPINSESKVYKDDELMKKFNIKY